MPCAVRFALFAALVRMKQADHAEVDALDLDVGADRVFSFSE